MCSWQGTGKQVASRCKEEDVDCSSCQNKQTFFIQCKTTNLTQTHLFCLFDLIPYVPSTIFQLNRDGSSWVEPVLG